MFRLDSDHFKNLSDTERFTFNSGVEQYCSGAETASVKTFEEFILSILFTSENNLILLVISI